MKIVELRRCEKRGTGAVELGEGKEFAQIFFGTDTGNTIIVDVYFNGNWGFDVILAPSAENSCSYQKRVELDAKTGKIVKDEYRFSNVDTELEE